MCGIVGYIGSKLADSVLLFGLYRLEYRGYDSAGIAVLDKGEIEIRKDQGKIRNLERLLKEQPVEGNIGIGHTRWATHGEPNATNAHPHHNFHQTIAVVHNGIIENYEQIRRDLQGKRYIFSTETDTEVIPQLFDYYSRKGVKDEFELMKNVIQRLEGRYAFLVIFEDHPEKIYFCKNGSPLIFGRGKGEGFLVSDNSAFITSVKEQCFLNDGDWGWITKDKIELFNASGEKLEPAMVPVNIDFTRYEKNGYEHFMLKEIHEQSQVISNIIKERITPEGEIVFPELKVSKDFHARLSRIVFTSAGTSLHAGMIGRLYIEKFAKIMTEVEFSSEFRYRNPILDGDTLVVSISQSGETADTLASILSAKAKFLTVVSFVNNINSSIARESTGIIPLMAGPEIGVASTKAFTTQLAALMLLVLKIGTVKKSISVQHVAEITAELWHTPKVILDTLRNDPEILRLSELFVEKQHCLFLGRGTNFPIALEGALKLKEISYIHAEGYAAGELKHGPLALVDNDMPVVILAPKDDMLDKLKSNMEEVQARGGELFVFADENSGIKAKDRQHVVYVPSISPILAPIVYSVPVQLLSYHVAVLRGTDVDQPRNLAKSVTVE